ncbi:MAG: tyrosine-type recombinase/integrase [Pyrinomonadaceae bacterium]|nr:tyrosine-type recombinase/integrase [Pyrinomonadaceae bacterium]
MNASATSPAPPDSPWQWRVNLASYDRHQRLRLSEQEALADLNERFDAGLKHWPEKSRTALWSVLQPLHDVLDVTGAAKAPRNSAVHLLIREVHQRQSTYWAWTEAEWLEVLCPTEHDFHVRHKWSGNCRQYAIAISYLLCGFSSINEIGTFFQSRLAIKVFGREAVEASLQRVQAELAKVGYGCRVKAGVPHALYSVMLLNRSPRLEDLTRETLETIFKQSRTVQVRKGVKTLSHSLVRMGILHEPLHHSLIVRKSPHHYRAEADVPAAWLEWCRRWLNTTTLAPPSRAGVYYSILKTGRWLAHHYPEITSPAQWIRELAIEYVAAVDRMKVGEWSNPGGMYINERGKPLRPQAKDKHLGNVRAFFRDCQEWKWIPRRFDPYRALATPRSVRALIHPDPRIIADDIWAKLLWAGINFEVSDLPACYFKVGTKIRLPQYPVEMVRALILVWLFAGLRQNEIMRLRVGCVRWNNDQSSESSRKAVCLLDVPTNKTCTAFTKPVDRLVGEAIEKWEPVRLKQPPALDQKTGEMVCFLFSHRGKQVGRSYINRSLIPMLCRKARVSESDARGRITCHRARSTIASQLYNAKEPMSLFELQEWLGHRSASSTQHYAKITPTKLAQAYSDAGYFGRNVRAINVLIDQAAIQNRPLLNAEPWKYYDLGHGYCTYDFFEQCPHRMACAKCSFYVPKGSCQAQLLEAKANLQHMMQEIPLREEERAAVEDGLAAVEKLYAQLVDVPTPAGPTPRELSTEGRRELPILPARIAR